MIAIVDYGMGNIHSVQKALEFMGAQTTVTNQPDSIKTCDKVVLPGVGAFDDAVLELERQDLVSALKEHIKHKKTFLGICLGMQLLFEDSQEANKSRGLGILKGKVLRFDPSTSSGLCRVKSRDENKIGLKVPHIGWNQIKIQNPCLSGRQAKSKIQNGNCPLLKDIPDNSYVYFCHSYYPNPHHKNIIATTTNYGLDFASIIWQDNIYGVQFHPEKSQAIGMKIIENFVNLC